MKRINKYWLALAAGASFAPLVHAQDAAIAAAAGPAAAQVVPVTAAPTTLWSFLGLSAANKAACKDALCKSQLGQLLNNGMTPFSALSGGIIPSLCPQTPSAADLAQDGAEGTAAQVKKDEAGAKARRAAVRYLGTVDCHYWPEVAGELVNSLRADKNECVRFEAAMALARGCCCTKETVKALSISAAGTKEDKNPEETSPRVRDAACLALEHCLSCMPPEPPKAIDPKLDGKGKGEQAVPIKPVPQGEKTPLAIDKHSKMPEYYQRVRAQMSMETIVEQAREVLKNSHTVASTIDRVPAGQRSVYGIVSHVLTGGATEESEMAREIRSSDSRAVAVAPPPVVVVRPPEPKVLSADAAPKYGLMDVLHGTKPNVIYVDKETVVTNVADTGKKLTPAASPISLSPVASNNSSDNLRIGAQPSASSTSMKPVAPVVMPNSEKMSTQVPYPPAIPAEIMQAPTAPAKVAPVQDKTNPQMLYLPTTSVPMMQKPAAPAIVTPAPEKTTSQTVYPSPTATFAMQKPAAPANIPPMPEKKNMQTLYLPVSPAPVAQPSTASAVGGTMNGAVLAKAPYVPAESAPVKFDSAPGFASVQTMPAASVPARPALPRVKIDALVETLQKDQRPWIREEAANSLAGCDGNRDSDAVSALAHAAVDDTSLLVRYASLRTLREIKANTPEVRATLLRVRAEGHSALQEDAARALEQMSATPGASKSTQPGQSGLGEYAPRGGERSGY